MTTQDMIARIKGRTFQRDDFKIIGELNAARSWAYDRLYNCEFGPDALLTEGEELTLTARTRQHDLVNGTPHVTGAIYGIKLLWFKLPNDSTFTPGRSADTTELRFIFNDQWTNADTTTVAAGHPILYSVVNFSSVRFSPPLPAGTVLRVDYFRKPPDLDPATNETLSDGNDLPDPLLEPVIDKATATIFNLMDDDRWVEWDRIAENKLSDALYVVKSRVQQPTKTTPYRIRRRRWI